MESCGGETENKNCLCPFLAFNNYSNKIFTSVSTNKLLALVLAIPQMHNSKSNIL